MMMQAGGGGDEWVTLDVTPADILLAAVLAELLGAHDPHTRAVPPPFPPMLVRLGQRKVPAQLVLGWEDLERVNKRDLDEVSSMANPPMLVQQCFDAVQYLMQRPPGWANARRTIRDPCFVNDVRRLPLDDVPRAAAAHARLLTMNPQFTYDNMARRSAAMARFVHWVLGALAYVERYGV